HRIEGARGRTYEGTGIGLALVQELARLHGGNIAVTSRVGQGTTFEVSLPFGRDHLPAEHVQETAEARDATAIRAEAFTGEALTWLPPDDERPAPAPATGARKGRILLADDNADMREHVRHILGDDYDLLTADDSHRALQLIREDPPDLLLTDIMMPGLDGFELLKAVREDAATHTLPVIFISARAGEDMRVEGLQAGADDYLVKPFTAGELRARVGAHVKMALARRRASEREAALRGEAEAARDRVVQVLESITDAFVALDRDWRITDVNSEAVRLNGMRREDMLGRNHWELFPETVGTVIHRELQTVAEQRVAVEFENYYAPWRRWFHLKAYPAAGGGVSMFYEDITARKTAELDRAALLQREREARAEAETLHEVSRALAGELDLEKIVQTVTDAATRLTGAEYGSFFYNLVNEEGESYTLYTLTGADRAEFDRIGLPRNTPLFAPTFAGTAVVRCDDVYQHPHFGKNPPHNGMPEGHLPCRSYLAVPVMSRSREVLGGLFFAHSEIGVFTERAERVAVAIASTAAVAIDNARLFAKAEQEISQRTQAEQALRASETRFRQLADSMPQMVWTARPDGTIEYYNERWYEFTGCSRNTFDTASWQPALHPEDVDKAAGAWRAAVSAGQPLNIECRLRDRNENRWRWFNARAIPVRDEAGNIVRWFGATSDIDDQKRVQDELRRANQDLEQFAYSASHDLQEPLRGVKIYSDLLVRRYGPKLDEKALEFLGYVRGGATRMEMLVRDLLAYTQVTRFDIAEETSDADQALAESLANLKGAIDESRASVTSGPLPHLRIHHIHLQQVFLNLIGNAIKYRSPERVPSVHVSARQQDGAWIICVSDNGIGIEPEYKERIFGIFKRLHTGDQYSGTGIGLAICQRIVERYHGHIWVESEPGRGSNFFFTIPA
ncbi:MAG TPA: ATP-binding protein, partial [Bryobacteraceae bacterium]|nr:ATP-binding protein [Bryobacteraceae bacterium]